MTVQPKRLTDYGDTSALGEVELMAAHLEPVIQARPCACGGTVIADRRDPTEGVRLHQAEARHMDWQAVQEARRPTKRPCPCHGDES